MFAYHATRRALHVLLAGAALAMPLGKAEAQILRDAASRLGARLSGTTERSITGIWAASPGGGGHFLRFGTMTSAGLTGNIWVVEPTGPRVTGDLSLQRVSADRLVGPWTVEGRQLATVEITAPAGKTYLLLAVTTPRGKSTTYLRQVSAIGAAFPSIQGEAAKAAMMGEWNTPLGKLNIADEGGTITGTFQRSPGRPNIAKIYPDGTPSSEYQRWEIGMDDMGNEFTIVLSPDGQQFQASDVRGKLDGLTQWVADKIVSPPQPVPAPSPTEPTTPPRTPPPVAEAPPLPGTVQAGTFHSLEAFDVRLDEARAARDGTVHLFFTVRNDTGRDQQIGAGTFTAVMSDADGVGVREAQIWRATGDTPTQFDRPPVVAAGGEFKFRFVFTPPIVHAPLQRVSIRESDKKVLFFTVSGADPNPSRAGAPAPGGGAFKSLSKFDVRIDRLARARDGLLEAFLTLRNPGTTVETTSKGWIKLSGADADGGKATSRSALYSVRGERGNYDELPLLVYVEPGQQVRLRYVFDQAISGPITIGDGSVSQTFTAG
jgi:hypothetical protein